MSAAFTSVVCTNFGDCRLADQGDEIFDEDACPYCGKSIASPYTVTVEPRKTNSKTGETVAICVVVATALPNPSRADVSLFVNGSSYKSEILTFEGKRAEANFYLYDRTEGLSFVLAQLNTDEGYKIRTREVPILISQPADSFGPFLWALLVLLLLVLGAGLGWFGKPLFGGKLPSWLLNSADAVSLGIALLIGILLVDLGLRERALGDASFSRVRPRGSLHAASAGHQTLNAYNNFLNTTGVIASSWQILVLIGGLPWIAFLIWMIFFLNNGFATTIIILLAAVLIFFIYLRLPPTKQNRR
jgi:hypothetical protein